jgi:hypothetical protein
MPYSCQRHVTFRVYRDIWGGGRVVHPNSHTVLMTLSLEVCGFYEVKNRKFVTFPEGLVLKDVIFGSFLCTKSQKLMRCKKDSARLGSPMHICVCNCPTIQLYNSVLCNPCRSMVCSGKYENAPLRYFCTRMLFVRWIAVLNYINYMQIIHNCAYVLQVGADRPLLEIGPHLGRLGCENAVVKRQVFRKPCSRQ